jgi:predicted nucleotidyltransferase
MWLSDEELESTREALRAHKDVLFAYLFGSWARRTAMQASDIDLAVYFRDELTPSERFDLRLNLMDGVSPPAPPREWDVVALNDVSVTFAYEILERGEPLMINDRAALVDFRFRTYRDYHDGAYHRRLIEDARNRRIEDGSFGHLPALRASKARAD